MTGGEVREHGPFRDLFNSAGQLAPRSWGRMQGRNLGIRIKIKASVPKHQAQENTG